MSDAPEEESEPRSQDILARIKQITQPLVESVDSRLSAQVDKRVDQRVEETVIDRLSVIERAIADLDRAVRGLQDRFGDEPETPEAD
ncbi:MAG TPA: hypothetical protein VGG21_09240 [Acidimicrobiales bacterium]|jgi:hypothetical protein